MNESHTDPNRSDVDATASAACVRSGAFALLLSAALLLLIPTWRAQPMYAALGEYLAQRVNLATAIDDLDDDPVWRKYRVSNEAAESIPIGQLSDIQVDMATTGRGEATPLPKASAPPKNNQKGGVVGLNPSASPSPRAIVKPTPPPKNQAGVAGIERPAPPSGLNATAVNIEGIPEAPRILEALTKLNESDILTRTRQVSNFFEFSLVRWLNKRGGYAYRNALTGICTQGQLEVLPKGDKGPHFAPALTKEALTKCLTVHDVRELAHFELPEVSNPIQLGGRIEPRIEIAPGSLPRGTVDLYAATLAAQILLFFVVVYFGAFAREAVASHTFPAPGTLFGAFSKSCGTLLVLFLALLTPLGTSVAVAATARERTFAACVLFIACAVFWVYRVLGRKSYFRALNPRLLLQGKRPTLGGGT